jgi:suppressor for copper-sensitivity B
MRHKLIQKRTKRDPQSTPLRSIFVAKRRCFHAARAAWIAVGALLFSLASALPATAQTPTAAAAQFWPPLQLSEPGASPWDIGRNSAARLIASRTALVSEAPAPRGAAGLLAGPPLGIEFRLAPGWKTYWRSPGDAGLPPEIDWSGSENLAEATVLWPAPKRETLLGFETFIYQNRVVLPITARATDPAKPVRLRANVSYLVCEVLCVPAEATLALDLDVAPGRPAPNAGLIAGFNARVPSRASTAFSLERALLSESNDGLTLEVAVRARTPFAAPDIFIEGPRQMRFGKPRLEMDDERLSGVFIVPVTVTGNRAALSGATPFIFTVVDATDDPAAPPRMAEIEQTVTGVAVSSLGGTLGMMLLVAFAGGLILNLMPCVLPVLSMKLMGAMASAHQSARSVRLGFLATATGIVASMLALAGAVIAAKNGGLAVGWGVQFQAPVFLASMIVVVSLFAASLVGGSALALPSPVAALAGKGPRQGLAGAFLAGVFATLLATPCTAPLLGTAVGFALARGATEIVLVFAALGLGLAAPYLLVAAVPPLARALPRPGAWMRWVRVALGVGLFATALWLLAALAAQAGVPVAAITGAGAVVAAYAFASRRKRRAFVALASAAAFIAVVVPLVAPSREMTSMAAQGIWRPWDRVEAINQVAADKVVLVHVTAEWCLNCKVNQALVLERGAVAERLRDSRTVAMLADWTRADPRIGRFLAGFGRYGIPFDVVYGPKAPAGIVLPEILTADAVLAALEAAGGPSASGTALK